MALICEIRVAEQLDQSWRIWFEGLALERDERGARLVGTVADQAALYGLLNKLRDLRLSLVSVRVLDDDAG
jgi:hypothetical protein